MKCHWFHGCKIITFKDVLGKGSFEKEKKLQIFTTSVLTPRVDILEEFWEGCLNFESETAAFDIFVDLLGEDVFDSICLVGEDLFDSNCFW